MKREIVMYAAKKHLRALQALVAVCHPDRTPRPPAYWFAHATLVIEHPKMPGALIGYTAFSVVNDVIYGIDLGVHPDYRRQGLGRQLFLERLTIAAQLDVAQFIGTTAVDNEAMRALFASAGFRHEGVVPGLLADVPEPKDAAVYVGARGEWIGIA